MRKESHALGGRIWAGLGVLIWALAPAAPAQQPVRTATPAQEPVEGAAPVRELVQAPSPLQAEVLTLEQAVQRTLQHSPALAQATGAVESAASTRRTAWASFLPTLSLSSGASLASTERFNSQTNTVVRGSSDSYSAGLSASLNLFNGGRRMAELRQAGAETAAAEASLVEQRFAVILAAKTAFFEVLRAGELAQVAQARVERAQEGLDAAQRRLDVGSATRSDVLRAQLELANARQALLEAESQEQVASFALGRLVGADGPVGASSETPLEPQPLALTTQQLAERIVERAPMVRAAEAALTAADAGTTVARAQYYPSLRASSGYDWFNQDPSFSGARGSWGIRVGLSFPIFDGFQREAAVSRAAVDARIAQVQVEDARRGARAELERVLAALRLAEQQIALAEEAVAVAEEDLRVQEVRYGFGAATILDRITSQENLVIAETNLVTARYDYQLARAELEALAGREL